MFPPPTFAPLDDVATIDNALMDEAIVDVVVDMSIAIDHVMN